MHPALTMRSARTLSSAPRHAQPLSLSMLLLFALRSSAAANMQQPLSVRAQGKQACRGEDDATSLLSSASSWAASTQRLLSNWLHGTPSVHPALALGLDLPGASPSSSSSSTSPSSLLRELLEPILRAVPKKKVSHSRKSMRSANKGLKDRVDIVHCPGCGRAKLHHHLCYHCYGDINRRQKAELREQAQTPTTL